MDSKAPILLFGAALALLTPAADTPAQTVSTFTILYSFSAFADGAPNVDGGNPRYELVEDAAGNLYSTTLNGGTGAVGTIFKLAPGGVDRPKLRPSS